jgi:hypothetical protein
MSNMQGSLAQKINFGGNNKDMAEEERKKRQKAVDEARSKRESSGNKEGSIAAMINFGGKNKK